MTGAQFEIRIDGAPRSYRDRRTTRWRPPQFRKLYDLLGDGVPCRIDDPVSLPEAHRLESDDQETELTALQILPDRHGCYVGFN